MWCNFILVNNKRKLVVKRKGVILAAAVGLLLSLFALLQVHEERQRKRMEAIIYAALGSRNTVEYVKPSENTVLLDSTVGYVFTKMPPGVLGMTKTDVRSPHGMSSAENGSPFTLILVLSHIGPDSEERRHAIRSTWASWARASKEDIRVVFFVGVPVHGNGNYSLNGIRQEAIDHGDIILDDIPDSYYALTIKMLRAFKWFLRTYPEESRRPKYLIKVDHDVFVHIPNLVRHLKAVQGIGDYMGGLLRADGPVIRSGGDKFFVPRELWEADVFPTYVCGACYLLAGSVVSRIYKTGLQERLFHLEDVFLTGIVAKTRLGIQLSSIPKEQMPITYSKWFYNYVPNLICGHPTSPEGMLYYYTNNPK